MTWGCLANAVVGIAYPTCTYVSPLPLEKQVRIDAGVLDFIGRSPGRLGLYAF